MPLANLSLTELGVENKLWLTEKVKEDMKAKVVIVKDIAPGSHKRRGEPYTEEEEHKIVEWILVRERLESRKFSTGGEAFSLFSVDRSLPSHVSLTPCFSNQET